MLKNIIMTILMSILIPIAFLLMIYANIFTEKDILSNLDDMNYYDYIYKDISEKLKLELPNDDLVYIYSDYLTLDQIKKDVKVLLDNYYIDANDNIKQSFYNHVLVHFDETDVHIESLAKSLSNTYYNNLFALKELNPVIKKMPFKNSSKAIGIVLVLITLFLIGLFIKKIWIYNSLIVSGLILLIPKLFITFKDFLANFYYYNNSLSYFLKMYIYAIINNMTKYGIVLLIVGFIGIIITSCFNRVLTRKTK